MTIPDRFVDPTREQFAAMAAMESDGPIWMLNLIRLHKKAAYEDGRDATGAEAYKAYGRESAPFFQGVGGEILWSGKPELVMIGPPDEAWDLVFIAQYPSADAFLAMVRDEGYQAIVFHRQAAVETSRLIRLQPGESGRLFG